MSKRHRIWSIVRRTWITLGLSVTVIFVVWSLVAYRANSEARAAAVSDALVTVDHAGGIWQFVPVQKQASEAGLLFFPGALVDPRAYAPLARAVAQAGYRVTIVELPRRGAFGGADSPELAMRIRSVRAMRGLPARVVVGGHSRGAVVASRIAADDVPSLAGVVLIGSSHPRDHDLSAIAVPVTKVVGTRDGLASPDEVRQNAALLPAHTRWIWIEGGNHSQFGWYGFQPFDRRPRVAASTQRRLMLEAVLDVLRAADATTADRKP